MKNNLLYVTTNGWWHADLTIFPYLKKYFSIKILKIFNSTNQIQRDCPACILDYTEVIQKYSIRNPLNIISDVKIIMLLCFKYGKELILYEYSEKPYLHLLLLLFINPRRIIISWHDYIPHSGANKASYLFRKIFVRRFKMFLLHSENQYRAFLSNNNISNKKVFYTQLPLNDYGKPQGNFVLDKRAYKKIFLFFGSIVDYKNLKILIRAIEQINENILLIIAGRRSENWESDYLSLMKTKSKYSLNIRYIKDDEVADFFSTADFLVLPYSDTTQSGPLMIAINYCLPVIASNLDAFKSELSEKTGYLFEKDDLISLIHTINQAIYCTNEDYVEFKTNLKKVAIDYEKKVFESYENFCRQLIDEI